MNGEAVSYITRHGVPSLRTRSRPHPGLTPMTADERWSRARLRLCPATPPLTNGTAPSRLHVYALEEYFLQFLERLDAEGVSLPHFVIEEFEAYLKCGRLEYGFLRGKCDACRHEKLVAFSCKRRGFCPSCGARRMAETAAHLAEHVLPEQPIRQWVLSFPYPLRFLFATRPAVLTQVLGIVYRAVSTFLGPGAETAGPAAPELPLGSTDFCLPCAPNPRSDSSTPSLTTYRSPDPGQRTSKHDACSSRPLTLVAAAPVRAAACRDPCARSG